MAYLNDQPEIQVCLVYGSHAGNSAGRTSDVDVAVAGRKPFDGHILLTIRGELTTLLGREVDLVDLRTLSGVILHQVLTKGRIVSVKNHDLYAQLIARLLFNEADMMPYYRRILRQRRGAFVHGS